MKYWFLSSPYSRYEGGHHAAYKFACYDRALLIRHGVHVFSPVIHSHDVAYIGGLDPLDADLWMEAERPFRFHAYGLIVLTLAGWQDSVGVSAEIKEFEDTGRKIVYMTPGVVPEGLL